MQTHAINSQKPAICTAINVELQLASGGAPEFIQLLPAGEHVTGRDGRSWLNDTPESILSEFEAANKDMPLDWEHSTELKAPKGEPAPAAGWITDLELRDDGSLWGRVEWTEKGRQAVESREYRYLSPVFVYHEPTKRILQLTSAGLTNRPNLHLSALNRETTKEENKMDEFLKKLLAALGLPDGTTFDQALEQIAKVKTDLSTAQNSAQTPSLDQFVPKADYDLAMNRATTAEGKLASHEKSTLMTAINNEIDTALKAGKITPATKDYHIACCQQEGGLERFKAFCQTAPVYVADSNLDKKKLGDNDTALNAEEAKIAAMFGNSADDILKYGNN
jgi:phage I-like protein